MGVADHLERAADLIAEAEHTGTVALASVLSQAGQRGRDFKAAKDAFLETTRFVTLGDYMAERGRTRKVVMEDLRKAAAAARGQREVP